MAHRQGKLLVPSKAACAQQSAVAGNGDMFLCEGRRGKAHAAALTRCLRVELSPSPSVPRAPHLGQERSKRFLCPETTVTIK